MKKRTRRFLFWLAVFIFAAATYGAVRYAQGYKYDWTNRRFVRTGAIAVTANADAKLFVDDRLVDSLSFLSRRAGRDRLLPGSHAVRLVRDGWSVWQKEAQVAEGQLTDFPSAFIVATDDEALLHLRDDASKSLGGAITLADITPSPTPTRSVAPTPKPAKPTPTPVLRVESEGFFLFGDRLFRDDNTASGSLVAEQVLGFSLTENKDRILWWTHNDVWVLWLRSTDYQPYRAEGERAMTGRWASGVTAAAWFHDRDHVVVDLGKSGYRIVELDQRGGTNTIRF